MLAEDVIGGGIREFMNNADVYRGATPVIHSDKDPLLLRFPSLNLRPNIGAIHVVLITCLLGFHVLIYSPIHLLIRLFSYSFSLLSFGLVISVYQLRILYILHGFDVLMRNCHPLLFFSFMVHLCRTSSWGRLTCVSSRIPSYLCPVLASCIVCFRSIC